MDPARSLLQLAAEIEALPHALKESFPTFPNVSDRTQHIASKAGSIEVLGANLVGWSERHTAPYAVEMFKRRVISLAEHARSCAAKATSCDEDNARLLVESLVFAKALRDWASEIQPSHGTNEQLEPVTKLAALPDDATNEAAAQFVTLDQAAVFVRRHKGTLARWLREDSTAPLPAVEGGGGKSHEYLWATLRPWLESKLGRSLPERFPSLS